MSDKRFSEHFGIYRLLLIICKPQPSSFIILEYYVSIVLIYILTITSYNFFPAGLCPGSVQISNWNEKRQMPEPVRYE